MERSPAVVIPDPEGAWFSSALTIAPTFVLLATLGAALAWAANSGGSMGLQAGAIGPSVHATAVQAPELTRIHAPEARLFIVAIQIESAVAVQNLLESEARLRRLLGEPQRIVDGSIVASNAQEAQDIADTIRADLGLMTGLHFTVVIVP